MARRPRQLAAAAQDDPEQRADHDRERYLARHDECRAHRETVAGNRTWHWGYCCPPPPLSVEQVECQECGGEIRGVVTAVRIGPVPEVERSEKPAAGRAPTRPKPPSKAALRRRLREAEAQASALRVQLAQLDEGTESADPGHSQGR